MTKTKEIRAPQGPDFYLLLTNEINLLNVRVTLIRH